jgi:hypothetical protein
MADDGFDAAVAIVDGLSPQSQLRVMQTFRRNSAGFPTVREAFVAAVQSEVSEAASLPLPESPLRLISAPGTLPRPVASTRRAP